MAALEKQLGRTEKAASKGLEPSAEGEPSTKFRFSANRLVAQRKKLGVSAGDMGTLIGVSAQTIYNWEAGKSRPRQQQLAAIAAVRGIGKKEAEGTDPSRVGNQIEGSPYRVWFLGSLASDRPLLVGRSRLLRASGTRWEPVVPMLDAYECFICEDDVRSGSWHGKGRGMLAFKTLQTQTYYTRGHAFAGLLFLFLVNTKSDIDARFVLLQICGPNHFFR